MTQAQKIFVAFGMVSLLAPSGVAGQEPDSVVVIEPVLVRVLKTSMASDLPYSVSVAAGRELTRASSGAFLEEAVRAIPGIQIQNRFNMAVGERISIRGHGPRAQFGIRGIRVLVDGIPATLPDGQSTIDHLDLAGLGRVEVLRGPSAALYGNAAGGVLHFRTLDPSGMPAEASARAVGGSNGLLSLQSNVSGTTGAMGYRVGVSRLTYDGYRLNTVANDGSVYGGGTRTVANGSVSLPLGGGTLRIVANGVDLDADNPGSLSQTRLDQGAREAHRFNVISGTGKEVRQGQTGISWIGDVGEWDAEIATWGIRRELVNPIPGRVVDVNRNAGGARAIFNRGVDFAEGTLAIGGGVEGELQRDRRFNFDNDGGSKGDLSLWQIERVSNGAAFVQGRVDMRAGVTFLAGVRYDRTRFKNEDKFVTIDDPDESGARVMDALSPSAGFVIDAGDDFEVFASVASSFETPTTTELVNQVSGAGGFNPALEPQKGFTVEGGLRGRLSADATLEVTLFQTKLEGELVPFEVPSDPGRTYFQNAGQSLHRGWEVAADTRLSTSVALRVAYTRVNASFEEFRTDDKDYSGNRVPGLAPRRLDALLQADIGAGFFEARGLWQDEVPVDNGGAFASPSHFLMEGRVGLDQFDAGGLLVTPFVAVSNVFDVTYNSSVVVNAFGARYFEPGPGRTFSLGMGVTFGR
ncbi:MAG: TonB-dependent receptor [Gemmatimonadales bacterium]|nr:TonB-dependent receptor [Gemmatimonadales bacterium]MDG2241061.1 TonB-dependent receptor [Longimicrobiales bacterium]MBT3499555.1 TonB-dependent receptor [Gemmatimonadales bacterium]MBT3776219.1 TonB-dependent receptor [Gemmatimonadales bacterium]MBT3959342.1 TonB-dependent receptor [Gemmatimonadales bacterium]